MFGFYCCFEGLRSPDGPLEQSHLEELTGMQFSLLGIKNYSRRCQRDLTLDQSRIHVMSIPEIAKNKRHKKQLGNNVKV